MLQASSESSRLVSPEGRETVVVEPETQADETIVPAGTWSADPAHSSVEFNVKHPAMFATVTGRFAKFEASVEAASEEPESARAVALIEAASIDTNQSSRDDDLRSPGFFDAATYPQIRFESRRIERVKDGTFRIVGDLTIKDMTRELEFEAIVQGVGSDPYGTERVGLEARGQIEPRDFGIDWEQVEFAAYVSAVRSA
jgi:polyisoprenoid-binding protein YceI